MMANQLTEPSQTYDSPLITTMVIAPPSPVFACALTALFALMAFANVALGVEPRLTSIVHVEFASTLAGMVPYLYRDTENYATDTEHTAQLGVMTNPKDQFVVFITAVLLFGNVMLRL